MGGPAAGGGRRGRAGRTGCCHVAKRTGRWKNGQRHLGPRLQPAGGAAAASRGAGAEGEGAGEAADAGDQREAGGGGAARSSGAAAAGGAAHAGARQAGPVQTAEGNAGRRSHFWQQKTSATINVKKKTSPLGKSDKETFNLIIV